MFKKQYSHVFGNSLGTIPDVKKCNRCGKYEEVPGTRGEVLDGFGTAHLFDLPREIFTNMVSDKQCVEPTYTEYELRDARDSAFNSGWVDGQDKGIHLQPEFTHKFFNKIRLNPNTLVYEIPHETYQVLKDSMRQAAPSPNTEPKEAHDE